MYSRTVLFNFLLIFFILVNTGLYATNELVPLWRYAAAGELVSPPAVSGNRVYIYSEDRQIHAVSSDGKPLWKYRLPGRPVDSLAAGPDGTVYACTLDGRMFAVNPGGRSLWTYRAEGEPAGPPAVSPDGTVYFTLKYGELSAVSHTGFVRWKINTGYGIAGSPVIDAGEAVYFADGNGTIHSYAPWGAEQWTLQSDRSSDSKWFAAVEQHVLYSAYGKQLKAVTGGEVLWERQVPSFCTGLVIFEGGLFCSLADGRVMAINTDGTDRWNGEGGSYDSYPVAGGNRVFMLSSGSLVSLDGNGQIEGRGRVDATELTQPVMGSGLLVCGSKQWVVCAFNVSDELGSGWSQKGGGPAHSGFSGAGRWHFNETTYLANMDYLYLRRLIMSGTADEKLSAVREIGDRIAADGIDRGERYLLHLLHIAVAEGSKRLSTNLPPAANDFPDVRREAARLIGLYGNFESIELLTSVLEEEKHYDVSAAIIRALGTLGSDYRNLPQITIYNKVIKDNNGSAYDSIALAAIYAIKKLNAYSGVTDNGYGYRTLIYISRGNYSAGVRKTAAEVLRSIK